MGSHTALACLGLQGEDQADIYQLNGIRPMAHLYALVTQLQTDVLPMRQTRAEALRDLLLHVALPEGEMTRLLSERRGEVLLRVLFLRSDTQLNK